MLHLMLACHCTISPRAWPCPAPSPQVHEETGCCIWHTCCLPAADISPTHPCNRSVYEEIAGGAEEIDLNGRSVPARAYCSWYNFKSADQQKKVGMLSGGWRGAGTGLL